MDSFRSLAIVVLFLALPLRVLAQPTVTPALRQELSSGTPLAGGRVMWGGHHHRVLHFTFDDGPSTGTRTVADVLEAHGTRGTFFVVGRQLEPRRREGLAHQRLVRELVARGHSVGVHTWSHADLTEQSDARVLRELADSERALTQLLGARPVLFRPPYGHHDARVDALAVRSGYTVVTWNVALEPEHQESAAGIVTAFERSLRAREHHPLGPGGIVLFHDTRRTTVEALPRVLAAVRARNCELLRDGGELWDLADDLAPFYDARVDWDPAERRARIGRDDGVTWEARQRELRVRHAAVCRGAS